MTATTTDTRTGAGQFGSANSGASMPVTLILRSPSLNVSPSTTQAAPRPGPQAVKLAATRSGRDASGPNGGISDGSSSAPPTSSSGTSSSQRRMSRRWGLNEGGRRVGLKNFLAIAGE